MTLTGLLVLASRFKLIAAAGVPGAAHRVRGMFYGWFMVGLSAVIMALGGVPIFNGLSVWNPVLRNSFGWTSGQMSWGYAITQIEGGFLGPVIGILVDRLGPRRMVFTGLVVLGSGFVLFSQIRDLWQLYLAFVIMSFGSSLSTWLPMMTLVNHWFIRRRAVAMSLAMEGYALGGIFVPILMAWAIGGTDPNISERFGWRTTALFIGVLCLASAGPLSRLVRNRPEELGLQPDGDRALPTAASPVNAGSAAPETGDEGYTWQEAVRTAAFWLISLGHSFAAIIIVTISVHLGLMLDDRGFSLQTISLVLAVYTAVSAIFMPVGGYLGDRLPMKLVAFGFSSIQAVAVLVLVLAHDVEMLFLFAVLFGVGFGGRSSLMTALRGAYFGRKAFAAITGISIVPMNILLFIAPVFAGLMRDATGSYDLAFLSIAAASLSGSCLFLLLGEPPRLLPRTAERPQAAA